MRHIGLLGGSFDPIHLGHIVLAQQVIKTFALDQVQLIPCFQPAHRQSLHATAAQRLHMAKLACQNNDKLCVNDIEYRLKSVSYTVNTLKALKKELNQCSLSFIMGVDAFKNFDSWHQWQEILTLTNLIVATRPNYSIENNTWFNEYQIDNNDLKNYSAGKITFFNFNALDISSTIIRQRIKKNVDVSRNLKSKVYNFIKQEGLYAT